MRMNSAGSGMQALPLLASAQNVSTGYAKWGVTVPGEDWIKAMGCGIPVSLITEGKLCRGTWENPEVGTVPDLLSVQSLDSPALQTSAACFYLDQRGPTSIPSMQTH